MCNNNDGDDGDDDDGDDDDNKVEEIFFLSKLLRFELYIRVGLMLNRPGSFSGIRDGYTQSYRFTHVHRPYLHVGL